MPSDIIDTNHSDAINLLKERLSKFETEHGRLNGLNYKPSPNDIVITTTPKAGTTWMQQICHQIRSRGTDTNYDEISVVVPWLELAYDQGQDLYAPQYGHGDNKPRLFKTHCWSKHCPNFHKVIVVIRHPYDVLISFYRFFEDWFFESGTISIDEFANEFWLARNIPDDTKMQNASYFVHLVSWYKEKFRPIKGDDNCAVDMNGHNNGYNNNNILFVFFEDLKENLELEVRRIAWFMSNDEHNFVTDEIIQIATKHSTFQYMKQHENQFDEKLSKLARNVACGLPVSAGLNQSKLKEGEYGLGAIHLSDNLKSKIDEKWKEIVQPVTNCESYEEFRAIMKNKIR